LALKFWNPALINCHSGVDSWTFEESCDFFTRCVEFEKTLPVPVVHETHRRRVFYSPFVTLRLLKKFPEIKVNLDISHWTVVCERIFELEPWWPEMLKLLVERCL